MDKLKIGPATSIDLLRASKRTVFAGVFSASQALHEFGPRFGFDLLGKMEDHAKI